MTRKLKIGVLALVLIGFGSAMYVAGQSHLLRKVIPAADDKTAAKSARKPSVTKPQGLSSRVQEAPASPAESVGFTFFDTLDDTEMASYVNLNGEVVNPPHLKETIAAAPAVAPPPPRPKPQPSTRIHSKAAVKGPPVSPAKTQSKKQVKETTVPSPPVAARPETAMAMLEALSATPPAPSPVTKPSRFWVQVSSFRERNRADTMVNFLKKKGYAGFVEEARVANKGTWYRVYLGKFAERKEAERVSQNAKKRHGLAPVIVPAG